MRSDTKSQGLYRFQQKYQSKCEIETIGQMIGSLSDQLSVISVISAIRVA